MQTPVSSIVCFMIAALMGAAGQYLYKSGADATDATWQCYVVNARLVGGVFCHISVMVLFVAANVFHYIFNYLKTDGGGGDQATRIITGG